jgi:hypothetical protein
VDLQLYVDNEGEWKNQKFKLSYQGPEISSITGGGCSTNKTSVTNCGRVNGTTVTIKGTNFGRKTAKVLIAGVPCGDVTHAAGDKEHEELTCKLQGAPKSSTVQAVVLIPGALAKSLSEKFDLEYRPCDLGWQRKESDPAVCEECPAGKFRGNVKLDVCENCVGFVVNNTCEGCPANSFFNASKCLCQAGYYFNGNGNCSACPENFDCLAAGKNESTLKPKPGYFATMGRMEAYSCPNEEACGGGETGCQRGYTGPLCANCEQGLTRDKRFVCAGSQCHEK